MRSLLAVATVAAVLGAGATIAGPDEREHQPIGDPPEIPDRVSIEQDSPHFFERYMMLGVRVDGKESQHVVEFSQSEGWARICQRNGQGRMKRDSLGRPITVTIKAKVEPYWRDTAIDGAAVVSPVAERHPAGEKPAISRQQARILRQEAARAAKVRS